MVGMVVTISPNLSLYRMVVLPAASNPTGRRHYIFTIWIKNTGRDHIKESYKVKIVMRCGDGSL